MGAVLNIVYFVIGTVFAGLIITYLLESSADISKSIVSLLGRSLPSELACEHVEQWSADIEAVIGPTKKLVFVVGLVWLCRWELICRLTGKNFGRQYVVSIALIKGHKSVWVFDKRCAGRAAEALLTGTKRVFRELMGEAEYEQMLSNLSHPKENSVLLLLSSIVPAEYDVSVLQGDDGKFKFDIRDSLAHKVANPSPDLT